MATHDNDPFERNSTAYSAEHGLAWLTALGALVLGAIGMLLAFGVIEGSSDGGADLSVPPAEDTVPGPSAQVGADSRANWEEGALWLLPAISLALVSRALHSNEHHTRRQSATDRDNANEAMFNVEHVGAYLIGLGTLVAAALTLLVGYDVFDNGNSARDGMMWGLFAILYGVVTETLHAVRHHQLEIDEDVLARALNRRTGDRELRGPTTTRSVNPR